MRRIVLSDSNFMLARSRASSIKLVSVFLQFILCLILITNSVSHASERQNKIILFGDLHVHTNLSADAFLSNLPLMSGEGVHLPDDACDFARFCSKLDFYALTDHAENMTHSSWMEIKESIRQCNLNSGSDLIAYTGFEWSQVGSTPDKHFGHKNVIYPSDEENQLPSRPIGSSGISTNARQGTGNIFLLSILASGLDPQNFKLYLKLYNLSKEMSKQKPCKANVNPNDLPLDCMESASTPSELFKKLDQWGLDALVIPHGSTWGFYTPPGYDFTKKLSPENHNSKWQNLIEIYSGHGNAEEYRNWNAVTQSSKDKFDCPSPSKDYEPCCWKAGEIIKSRCKDPASKTCKDRIIKARHDYANAGVGGRLTIPGSTIEDWGSCGQCKDCYSPAFNYRPRGSVQNILSKGMDWGFIASSDNHSARPGTGYKEVHRLKMTDSRGPKSKFWNNLIFGATGKNKDRRKTQSRHYTEQELLALPPFKVANYERQSTFFLTGGLVAVHSDDKERKAVFSALKRKEVYATSGERILLWFNHMGETTSPMGSHVVTQKAPKFSVRAMGAFKQNPGCPKEVIKTVGKEKLEKLCAGECHFPSSARKKILRIEVVKIQPETKNAGNAIIEDPWKVIPCSKNNEACEVEFEDQSFLNQKRPTLYYVRAIQEKSQAINAKSLRCSGKNCEKIEPCHGGYQTKKSDDCLSTNNPRAWASPIFVNYEK